jgi:hypothetical protein
MEEVLAGRSKMIVDSTRGRRQLTLVDDGLGIAPAVPQQQFYQPEGAPGSFGEQPPSGQQPQGNPEQE